LKRLIIYLALGLGLVSGCSDSQTFQTTAGISGSYDVALVGKYLFVTSSDRNELRVLDLERDPQDWVRAPNPIEPLSIPVLERPIQLARDVRYLPATVALTVDSEGNPTKTEDYLEEVADGPYVYARSAGSRRISVVSTALLKEATHLDASGLVTAFAARGPMAGKSSILYYAAQDAAGAKLYRVELSPEAPPKPHPVGTLIAGLDLTGETVTALLVLPPPLGMQGQEHLVVATRRIAGTPGGRTFRVEVDMVNGSSIRADYQFGAPVRLLATHPLVADPGAGGGCDFDPTPPKPGYNPDDLTGSVIAAGAYVFGVLDESFCGGQAQCSGVLAVESATGLRPNDSTGFPMLPITVGEGLPTGLTLAANAGVAIRCINEVVEVPADTPPDKRPQPEDFPLVRGLQVRPLVGIMPSTNGDITLFDAVRLRPFDFDKKGARVAASLMSDAITGRTIELTSTTTLAQAFTVGLREGSTVNDTFRLVFEGGLPNLGSRVLAENPPVCDSAAGTCLFQVDAKVIRRADGTYTVTPGDLVTLEGDPTSCQKTETAPLLGDLVVSEVRVSGGIAQIVTPLIPAECEGQPRYSIRVARGTLAAYSDVAGYVGRLGAGERLKIPGRYYFRPVGFDPALDPVHAELTREEAFARLAPQPKRGDQYVISVQSGFQPYVFRLDTTSLLAGLGVFRLPGPVVHTQIGGVDFAYIAYPSADGILRANLGAIVDNEANARGLTPFQ
jgi:hypothetical protein